MSYTITTTEGVKFTTDDNGAVIARSNGPNGFDYSGKWIILGASKRHHSHTIIPLGAIANGEDFGQGWVHDIDHGTHRVWFGLPGRIKSVTHH